MLVLAIPQAFTVFDICTRASSLFNNHTLRTVISVTVCVCMYVPITRYLQMTIPVVSAKTVDTIHPFGVGGCDAFSRVLLEMEQPVQGPKVIYCYRPKTAGRSGPTRSHSHWGFWYFRDVISSFSVGCHLSDALRVVRPQISSPLSNQDMHRGCLLDNETFSFDVDKVAAVISPDAWCQWWV